MVTAVGYYKPLKALVSCVPFACVFGLFLSANKHHQDFSRISCGKLSRSFGGLIQWVKSLSLSQLRSLALQRWRFLCPSDANTAGVIGAAGKAFSQSLGVALSPVTGGGNNLSGFTPSF
jgi:hypothetical protein